MKYLNIAKNCVKLLMCALMIAVFSVGPTAAQTMVATTTLPAYRPATGFSAGPRTVKVNAELVDGRWVRGVICLPDVSWEGYRYNGILYTNFVNENNWLEPYTISGTIVISGKWKVPIESFTLRHGEQCTTPNQGGEPIGIPEGMEVTELTSLRLENFRIDNVNRNAMFEKIIEGRLGARKKLDVLKQQVASAETATENELQILLNRLLLERWPTEVMQKEAEALADQVRARMTDSGSTGPQQDNYSSGNASQAGSDNGSNESTDQVAEFLEAQARQQAQAEDAIAGFTNAVTDLAGTIISEYQRNQRKKAAEEAEDRAKRKRRLKATQARLNEHARKRASLSGIIDGYRRHIAQLLTKNAGVTVTRISELENVMRYTLSNLLQEELKRPAAARKDSVYVAAILPVPITYLPDNYEQIRDDYRFVNNIGPSRKLTDDEVREITSFPGIYLHLSPTHVIAASSIIGGGKNNIDQEVLTYVNPWAPPHAKDAFLLASGNREELERLKSAISDVDVPNIFINQRGLVEETEALQRLRAYLRYFPEGRLAERARTELAAIEEKRYQAVKRSSNRYMIAEFIEAFPNNPHVPALSRRLASLTNLHNYQSQIYELESDLISYRASKDVFLWGGVITGSLGVLTGALSNMPELTGLGVAVGGSFVLYSLYKMSQISSTKQELQRLRNEGPQWSLLPRFDVENKAISMGFNVKF